MDGTTAFLLRYFGFDYKKISPVYIRNLLECVISRYKMFNEMPYEDYIRLLHGYMISVGDDNDIDLLRQSEELWDDEVIARWNASYTNPSGRASARKEFESMYKVKLKKLGTDLQFVERKRMGTDPVVMTMFILCCLLIVGPFIFVESVVTNIENALGLPFILGVIAGGIAVFRCSRLYPSGLSRQKRNIRNIGIGLITGAFFLFVSVLVQKIFPNGTYTRSFSTLFLCIPMAVGMFFCSYGTGLKELIRCKTCREGVLHKKYRFKAPSYAGRSYSEDMFFVTYEFEGITYSREVSSLKDFPFLARKKHNDNETVRVWIDPESPETFSLHRVIPPVALAALLMTIGAIVLGIMCFIFPEMA